MAKYTEHVPLSGSERAPLAGAKPTAAADPSEQMQVTVLLKSKSSREARQSAVKDLLKQAPAHRKHLSRQEFAAARGADPADIEKVTDFAHQFGLTVVSSDAAKRSVVLAGTVANFSHAFQVELRKFEHAKGSYRGRTGPVYVPKELDGTVTAVLGLDNRPVASPHFRTKKPSGTAHVQAALPPGAFPPPAVASLYDYPSNATGQGECIAIIELGGGYRAADITHYFKSLGIATPKVSAISVDNGQNSPTGDGSGPDGEVMLDIEVAGSIAPQAKLAVYFTPNTDQGFYDAISAALHDTTNNPSVISISWGGPESTWSQQSLTEYNTLLEDATTLGVSVCVAVGDNGSTDNVTDGLQHADFPASSPYSLACGGTKLTAANGKITSEVVWNELANGEGATGGGISAVFPKPDYQANANVPPSVNPGNFVGRGIPDVAGDADPETGYDVYVDGQATVIGGTSAVAPLWAGLIARINQLLGKPVGFLNPTLYAQPASAGCFHDITSGTNGAYNAGPGWDPCTGLGSPDGAAIEAILSAQPQASPPSRSKSVAAPTSAPPS
ncbi:MAG TPA: S53 family peptidase [Candidatus Baltobacteraceae bacterium]|nr:S53 family peptidase [Candidatus Baltobacteraceae bacterium]